jgi:3-dehydroquinate synthase
LSDIDQRQRERLLMLLEAAGLPVAPPPGVGDSMRASMQLDKKACAGNLRFVLLDRLGAARVSSDFSEQRLRDILGHSAAAAQ